MSQWGWVLCCSAGTSLMAGKGRSSLWEGRRGRQVQDPGPTPVPIQCPTCNRHLLVSLQFCVLSTEKGGRCPNILRNLENSCLCAAWLLRDPLSALDPSFCRSLKGPGRLGVTALGCWDVVVDSEWRTYGVQTDLGPQAGRTRLGGCHHGGELTASLPSDAT